MSEVDIVQWAELVKDLGFPIAIALILMSGAGVLLAFAIRAAKWFGREIVIPLRDAHTNFLVGLQESQISIKDSLARLSTLQEQHQTETEYIRKLLEKQNKRA